MSEPQIAIGTKMSAKWGQYHAEDVRALIEQYPLAWVCSTRGFPEAAQLPMIAEYGPAGELVALIGHMARANPLHGALMAHGETLVLFSGPAAYISPEHAGKRDWAPTWNYAQLRVRGDVLIDEALTDMSLAILTAAMEQGRAEPWTAGEIAHRYAAMTRAIIGFRIDVTALEARFKLAQDEDDATFARILDRHPDGDMVAWMRRLNAGRVEKSTGPLTT